MLKRLRENLGWLLFGFVVAIPLAYGAAAIFSGDDVKIFRQNLNMNDFMKILSDSDDSPNDVGASAPAGSLYLEDGGTAWLRKDDSGPDGWQRFADLHYAHFNILRDSNPGAEMGDDVFWSATGGTLGKTAAVADVGFGREAISWDAAVSTELKTASVTIPRGLYNKQCEARIWVKGGDENLTFKVTDGTNDLASKAMSAPSVYKEERLAFVCPSSGTLDIRIENGSGSAAPIAYFDDAYIGESMNDAVIADSHRMMAEIRYDKDSNPSCIWTTTATTPSAFNNNANCVTATQMYSASDSSLNITTTSSSQKPDIVFDDLPAGQYYVKATFTGGTNGTADDEGLCYSLSDGTNIGAETCMQAASFTANMHLGSVTVTAQFTHAGGAKTFSIYGDSNNSTDIAIYSRSGAQHHGETQIEVWKMTNSLPERAIVPSMQGWYVDASISGANPALLTTAGADTEITNGSLTISANENSQPVKIACASGFNPQPTNCDSVTPTESIGIAFDVPERGVYEVCTQFTQRAIRGNANWGFKLNHTQDASTTAISVGDKVAYVTHDFDNSSDSTAGNTVNLCERFDFTTTGQKTIRLMYQAALGGGAPAVPEIIANGTFGGVNIGFTVRPLAPHQAAPLITSSLNMIAGEKRAFGMCAFTLDQNGSQIIKQYGGENGDCVASYGHPTITFKSGMWKDVPVCTCRCQRDANICIPASAPPNNTTVNTANFFCRNYNGTVQLGVVEAICVGPQ